MKKEKIDEIEKLIVEGYTNVEVAKKTRTSVGTISKISQNLKKGKDSVEEKIKPQSSPSFTFNLTSEQLKKLGAIQASLGCGTLDETIDLLYSDVPKLMAYKFKASFDFHGTPSEVFGEVLNRSNTLMDATNRSMRDSGSE